jgi:hypothetical protein
MTCYFLLTLKKGIKMNPTDVLKDTMLAIVDRTNYIESTYIGDKINTLQNKMNEKLRAHAEDYRVTGHIVGFGVAIADLVLDIGKYPLVTIEHLAKALLEPLGVIIKNCTNGKFCHTCTLLSSVKHYGHGIKGAVYTVLSPLIALGLIINSYRTIQTPEKALSGWDLTVLANDVTTVNIRSRFPE